jgi:hypothetical protein
MGDHSVLQEAVPRRSSWQAGGRAATDPVAAVAGIIEDQREIGEEGRGGRVVGGGEAGDEALVVGHGAVAGRHGADITS